MSPADYRRNALLPGVAEMSDFYLDNGPTRSAGCLDDNELISIAAITRLSLFDQNHLAECVRCSSLSIAFRALAVIDRLPESASISLTLHDDVVLDADERSALQILGRICLDSLQFEVVHSEAEWESHPLFMRVNITVDSMIDLFVVSILDVPKAIESLSITTPSGRRQLTPAMPDGTYELFDEVSVCGTDHQPIPPAKYLLQFLREGKMQILFRASTLPRTGAVARRVPDVGALLKAIGAIEQEFAYVLPCGLYSDTHVNAAKICESEVAIKQLAAAIDRIFPEEFNVIVTSGWPLATIARRVAALRNQRAPSPYVREIMYEGYLDPMPVEEMPAGARAIVLVDVSVTGALLARLSASVVRFGGKVLARGTIVAAKHRLAEHDPDVRSLCQIPVNLSKTENTNELRWRDKRYFNPLSSSVTEKKHSGRSPTEFYNNDPEVRNFWNLLEDLFRTGAKVDRFYRRHKVIGNTHYSEFIDTLELLRHESVGQRLVEQVRDILAENHIAPDVILCSDRLRARTFAEMLSHSFEIMKGTSVPLVTASKRDFGWDIVEFSDAYLLSGRRVLICDTAIGHGKTVDQLTLLAGSMRPASVGVAVLLSRLSESCEAAFNRRLSDGLHRLFNLPIRPVVIRSSTPDICPICQRRAAIQSAAAETRSEAIEWLAASYSRAPFQLDAKEMSEHTSEGTDKQLTLFEPPSFLSTCHASVARGLTLHSLYAAKNNGMAPLSLPELSDANIPAKNRRAMVKDLPRGTLAWSGEALESTLENCLESDLTTRGVWSATAYVLASEQRASWLENLERLIERSPQLRLKPQPAFWNIVECSTYMIARANESDREAVERQLGLLAQKFSGTEAGAGLRRALETVSQLGATELT